MPLDAAFGRPPGGAPPTPLPPALSFSTLGIAPRDQFAAFHAASSGPFAVEREGGGAEEGFAGEVTVWCLGSLALRHISSDGSRFRRTEAQARRDCLDHWMVTIYRDGHSRGLCDGIPYETRLGQPFLSGLHRPLDSTRGRAELVSVFVPRDAAPELASRLDARLGTSLDSPLGALLALHIDALARTIHRLSAAEIPQAAEATLAVLRAAVASGGDAEEAARPALEASQRARLLALVRREIGSVRLDPGRLARLAGMSRTRLYEVFEPEGGVARAIQRERLRAVRRALADPAEARPIAALAEAMGFADPSVFSRAFRREFGLTAGEFRERARMGFRSEASALPAEAGAGAEGGLSGLLRRLRA